MPKQKPKNSPAEIHQEAVVNRHKPILTALKRSGYKVDEVLEQDKKIVITVSPR